MTRSCMMILRVVLPLGVLLILTGTGLAAAIPAVTILGAISSNLRTPGKIALDSSGNMYVADAQNRGILEFDRYGNYAGLLAVGGVVRSVAVTADGLIIVSHGKDVTVFSRSGAVVTNLAGFSFSLPNGITTDSAGNIYIADSRATK